MKRHDRIDAIAGAIALGEATDAERHEYREHLASCRHCLRESGGEHEIERVASIVTFARESETWSPDLRNVVGSRMQRRARKLQYGLGLAGLCVALSLGVHAVVFGNMSPLKFAEQRPVVFDAGATRIVLEQRANANAPKQVAQQPLPAAEPQRQLVVTHNVISMQRAPMPSIRPVEMPRQIAAIVVHPKADGAVKGAAGGRAARVKHEPPPQTWHTVATTTTTSQVETAPQTLTHSAESLQFAPLRRDRDAGLVGGETAINPQPPMIAYDEGAQGTAVFEVLIDDRGAPTKCVITKSTGFLVLDSAVCKAAMAAKYTPKIQDGRAVPGVYRDAFTFRMQDNPSIDGIPQRIQ